MKIIPIAFDSFGVRSMATYVETDKKILIDPGAALGPSRFGLPPSKQELKMLDKLTKEIINYAKKAEILCYKTSGDITGDYSSVVGYASACFTK